MNGRLRRIQWLGLGSLPLVGLLAASPALLASSPASSAAGKPVVSQPATAVKLVRTPAEYRAAAKQLKPGDTIALADGEWRDFEVLLEGNGTAAKPILLRAQTPGKVILTGQSNLKLAGSQLYVNGLVFRDGYSPSGEVIAFRKDSRSQAVHSRVSNVSIENFNRPRRGETEIWVGLYGRHNRFDHNYIAGKTTAGVTLAVRLDAPESNANFHRIDHNHFGPRPPLGSNGGETIRVGTSHNSLEPSNTTIENNLFEETSGEIEIVSIKSGSNTVRGNLFLRAQGGVALRHGNGNLVESNAFLGEGQENTGGVRVINSDQIVRNNLFVGLRGRGNAGALVVMNGVPNSPLNRYHPVRNAVIENNSFFDVSTITFGAGADAERTVPPQGSRFSRNLLSGPAIAIDFAASPDGISFADNVILGATKPPAVGGFAVETGEARSNPAAHWRHPAAGITATFAVVAPADAGPAWRKRMIKAGSPALVPVSPGTDTLSLAVAKARSGDRLVLKPGLYSQTRPIELTKDVSISGPVSGEGEARLEFDSATLFVIRGAAKLRLSNLTISGAQAPDAAGNSAIRVEAGPVPGNARIHLSNCRFEAMRINRSFAAIRAEPGGFVERLDVENCRFQDISGPAFSFPGDADSLGIYTLEEAVIRGSLFSDIAAPALLIERSGRDESTFGPRIELIGNSFERVGGSGPAGVLKGVQYARFEDNRLDRSARFAVRIEVGTPWLGGKDLGSFAVVEDVRPSGGSR